MACQNLRTLCRLRTPVFLNINTNAIPFTAPFSTTANLGRIKGGIDPVTGQRPVRLGILKRRRRKQEAIERKKMKKPAPGERKALRKRIILSNINAFEVPGLPKLTATTDLADPDIRGKMVALPGNVIDQLRMVDAFKPSQGWGMFRQPAMLGRREMAEVAKLMDEVVRRKEIERRVIVGERGSGKSVLLLQAISMAFLKEWVVINVPNCQDIMLGRSEYVPLPETSPLQYVQPAYTAQFLSQIARANEKVLSKFSITPDLEYPIPIPIPVQSNLSLSLFAKLGAEDRTIAWPIFCALWTELMQPGRPPLLVTIDEMNHLMRDSRYVAADMKAIHAHDLAIVAHFLPYIAGRTSSDTDGIPESIRRFMPGNLLKPPPPPPPSTQSSSSSTAEPPPSTTSTSNPNSMPTLPNGGLVLSAMTNSNKPPTPSLDLALAIAASNASIPMASPKQSYLNSPIAFSVNHNNNTDAGADADGHENKSNNENKNENKNENENENEITASTHTRSPPTPNPYIKHDFRVLPTFSTVPILRVDGLSHVESRTVLEYYAKSGMLRKSVDERLVAEAWTMAGGGVVGELERLTARLRI